LKASDKRLPAPVPVVDSSGPDVIRLANLIKAYAPHDGGFDLRIPGVHAIRISRTYTELCRECSDQPCASSRKARKV